MHPNTIFELATLRYRDLQNDAAQQRLASEAMASRHRRPGVLTTTRARFGAMLIDLGMRLQGMTVARRPSDAFGTPDRVGIS